MPTADRDVPRHFWTREPTSRGDLLKRHAAANLTPVMAGLVFPAAWWEIVIHGETYGADRGTRAMLACLPRRCYDSFAELVDAAAAVHEERAFETPTIPPGRRTGRAATSG